MDKKFKIVSVCPMCTRNSRPYLPFPVLGISVHISLTLSKTMLQWRSKAFTLPSSFLLFRQLIKTCVLFFTDSVRTESGPVLNSSSSRLSSSSGVISDLALFISAEAILTFFREIYGAFIVKCKQITIFTSFSKNDFKRLVGSHRGNVDLIALFSSAILCKHGSKSDSILDVFQTKLMIM